MKTLISYLTALLLYIFFSRAVSIPAALALHIRTWVVFLAVFGLDLLQIPLFFRLYEKEIPKIPILNLLTKRLPTKEQFEKSRIRKLAQSFGGLGVILVAAMPTCGGGMWTAVLLAHILKLSRKQSYTMLAIGSFISCVIFTIGFGFIFKILHIIPRLW
ncbi:MAG: small multi-drug export protein [bacterium]|nr:small multi-drug export protein [bacterium]